MSSPETVTITFRSHIFTFHLHLFSKYHEMAKQCAVSAAIELFFYFSFSYVRFLPICWFSLWYLFECANHSRMNVCYDCAQISNFQWNLVKNCCVFFLQKLLNFIFSKCSNSKHTHTVDVVPIVVHFSYVFYGSNPQWKLSNEFIY